MTSRKLAATIADALAEAGADTIFGLPGGGPNLDLVSAAEQRGLRFVLGHGETATAIMAAVYADLTDLPAACLVTRGPGAASAVNGVANALLDRQPLLVVTDCVSAADHARVAHQRLDQRALFAPVTVRSATVGTGDARGVVRSALARTMAEPRGPVHLDFDPVAGSGPPVPPPPPTQVDDAVFEGVLDLLAAARRPILLVGVGARRAVDEVRELVRATDAPVLTTYRAKGVVPESWPQFAGLLTGATSEAPLLGAADLVVLVGVDTVELIPAGWPYIAPVVALAAWPEDSPYLPIRAEVVGELADLVRQAAGRWPAEVDWPAGTALGHRSTEEARLLAAVPEHPDGVTPQQLVLAARAAAPADAIATVDAGAHMLPSMALWHAERPDEALISSGLASMGFALPAAVGAALARPGRRVICFTGDGGLGMCLGELETLRRLRLPVTVVVFNDACLSLIAIKAKADALGTTDATEYAAIDFAAVASGFGMASYRVGEAAELDVALSGALATDGPALVDVRIDPSAYPQLLAALRGPR